MGDTRLARGEAQSIRLTLQIPKGFLNLHPAAMENCMICLF